MRIRAHGAVVALSVVFVSAAPRGDAAPVNPDLSVIGDIRGLWDDVTEEASIELHEVEIGFVGPVNPYASAEVFLGIHGVDGIEVEEAKLVLDRYFPAGFGLTLGRKLLDFGQLNPVHAHAYPFLDRPLMHQEFFGDDGAADIGARLDWLAPVDAVTLRATAGVVRGDVLAGGHSHEEPAEGEEESEEDPELATTGRVDLFVEASRNVSFLAGGSVLHGSPDAHEPDAKATIACADAKVVCDLGPDRKLVVNAEAMFGTFDATDEAPAVDPRGWFASADLRASKRWNLGGFAGGTDERADDTVHTMRYGGFVGLALMEETTLFRAVVRRTDPDEGDGATEFLLQALFSLGPHRPHRY